MIAAAFYHLSLFKRTTDPNTPGKTGSATDRANRACHCTSDNYSTSPVPARNGGTAGDRSLPSAYLIRCWQPARLYQLRTGCFRENYPCSSDAPLNALDSLCKINLSLHTLKQLVGFAATEIAIAAIDHPPVPVVGDDAHAMLSSKTLC